jgi:hypothetical protein
LEVESLDVAMSEGGEALEDSKVGRLRFSLGNGMEEKGFEKEEEFP